MKTFYVTTPIYYANSLPHLGHLYTTVIADTLARYKRQRGFETYFLTGTDEHGINVQRAAENLHRSPKEHVDFIVGELQRMFAEFGLDTAHGGYDFFMRTTYPFHYAGAQALWHAVARARTPKGNEAIYKGFYEGWFCAACAAFKTEDEYAKPEREGDAPVCLIHETPLDRVSEEGYYFRLSDYDEFLLELLEAQPEIVFPVERRNEVTSFVRGGLQDLSISRLKSSVSWGIPVPDDPQHTMYVWFDALSNYITAIGYGNEERERAVGFEKFWSGEVVHLVGKDILRFHTVYWFSFLHAAGIKLPTRIIAHGLLLDARGRKMSKTLGNVVELETLHEFFSNDAIRYFILREVPFGQDGRFGYETLIERANSDLASGLGNLASRALTMINRYSGGVIPKDAITDEQRLAAKRAGVETDAFELAKALEMARAQFIQNFDAFAFNRALEAVWAAIARVDKLISDAKPWELIKSEEQRPTLDAVLYRAAETLRWLAVILYPVMPDASRALWRQLGQTDDVEKIDPANLKWGELQAGTLIGETSALFPRLEKKKIMAEISKQESERSSKSQVPSPKSSEESSVRSQESGEENQKSAIQTPQSAIEHISIDDFAKVSLRVGEILTAERVPKSDKLLRFTVDLGEDAPRQILAGIAEYYEPEKLIGKKIIVVANLAPRKLRGFESQGMVLAASVGEEGRPVLATFTEDVPNGARLK
jgi:methionyl-tRNA synthetase